MSGVEGILGLFSWGKTQPAVHHPHATRTKSRANIHTGPHFSDPPNIAPEETLPSPAKQTEAKTSKLTQTTLLTTGTTIAVTALSGTAQNMLSQGVHKVVSGAPDAIKSAANATMNALPEGFTSAISGAKDTVVGAAGGIAATYRFMGYLPYVIQGAVVISGLGLVLLGVVACRRGGGSNTVNFHVSMAGSCQSGQNPVKVNRRSKDQFEVELCTPGTHHEHEVTPPMAQHAPQFQVEHKYGQIANARHLHNEVKKLASDEKSKLLSPDLQEKITKILDQLDKEAASKPAYINKDIEKRLKTASILLRRANTELHRLDRAVTAPFDKTQASKNTLAHNAPSILAARSLHNKLAARLQDKETIFDEVLYKKMQWLLAEFEKLAKRKPPYKDDTTKTIVSETRAALAQADHDLALTRNTISCWQGRGVCKLPTKAGSKVKQMVEKSDASVEP